MRKFSESHMAIAFSISTDFLPARVTSLRCSLGPKLEPFCLNMSEIDRLNLPVRSCGVERKIEHLGMLDFVLDLFG